MSLLASINSRTEVALYTLVILLAILAFGSMLLPLSLASLKFLQHDLEGRNLFILNKQQHLEFAHFLPFAGYFLL